MCLRRFRGTQNVCYSLKSKLLTHRTYTKPIAYSTALMLKKNRYFTENQHVQLHAINKDKYTNSIHSHSTGKAG